LTLFHLNDEVRMEPHVWIDCPSNADFIRTGFYKWSDVSSCVVGTVRAYLHIIHENREFNITGVLIVGPDPVKFYWACCTSNLVIISWAIGTFDEVT
jgi:hypothetical protein